MKNRKWSVQGLFCFGKGAGTVEAETAIEALGKAENLCEPDVSVCHQCARSIGGDISLDSLMVYDEDTGEELSNDPRDNVIEHLNTRVMELEEQLEKAQKQLVPPLEDRFPKGMVVRCVGDNALTSGFWANHQGYTVTIDGDVQGLIRLGGPVPSRQAFQAVVEEVKDGVVIVSPL